MADTEDLKSSGVIRVGSSPTSSTTGDGIRSAAHFFLLFQYGKAERRLTVGTDRHDIGDW